MLNEVDMKSISESARDVWGIDAQMDKLIEESNELIKALVKYKECGEIALSHVVEEMVDVGILLTQMQYYLSTLKEVDGVGLYRKWLVAKSDRLKKILERERRNYEEIVSNMDAYPK